MHSPDTIHASCATLGLYLTVRRGRAPEDTPIGWPLIEPFQRHVRSLRRATSQSAASIVRTMVESLYAAVDPTLEGRALSAAFMERLAEHVGAPGACAAICRPAF